MDRIIKVLLVEDENDFAYLLTRHAANPPDIIFCPEDFIPAARLVNAAHEAGLTNTYLLGSDAWDGILAYITNPQVMENVYYSAPFSFDDPDEKVSRFVRNFLDFFAQMPLTASATAYTCVYILAEAITKAGKTDWDAIVSVMRESQFDTITGRIEFDENNNPYISVYVIQIKGGVYSTREKLSLR